MQAPWRPQLNGLACGGGNIGEWEVFEQTQHLHVLALGGFPQPHFEQSSQAHQLFGQLPTREWRGLIQRVRLALQQGQVMQRIEDQLFALVTAPMPGDLFAAAADDHLIDVGLQHYFAVAVARRNRVVVGPIAHQRQRRHPRRALVTSVVPNSR